MRARWQWWMSASLVTLMAACTNNPQPGKWTPGEPQPDPTHGQSEFVSADGRNGEGTQDNRDGNNAASGAELDAAAPDEEARTVEEGDIYRVMADSSLILNLNAYRGLQIIDFSDVEDPQVIGSLQVTGTPVEMYQVGDRVFILMNNWHGYWGSRTDVEMETFVGGLVLAVDVSDPTNPRITGQATVDGNLQTSRLTRGNGKEALYVVASNWGSGANTVVKSFKVSSTGTLAARTELDLGGYVSDIQASADLLMVARWNWSWGRGSDRTEGSEVTVIDITNPDGDMVEGETITVKGQVAKKSDMDHRGDVLRIVSGNSWSSSTNTNHVETFDVSDIHNIQPLDSATFGDNEDLYATLFMEDRAFFVTYRRVDPFHAFSVGPNGELEERSEFIISGWNDWFRPVVANTRMIGIGYNDASGGQALAVSLYNIDDLDNPSPLIQRQTMDQSWGWSEATWDDRAFSVLEKATSVMSPDGDLETGLVLLPFNGWNSSSSEYESGVRIFTFSDSSLTARGVMRQDSNVRRSFLADGSANTAANLSEAELSLYDTTNPDAPDELSRLELAPNYSDLVVFGDHAVRRRDNHYYYYWRHSSNPTDSLQIVPLAGDVDRAEPVAVIEIPAGAEFHKVGDLLAVVSVSNTEYHYDTRTRTGDTSIEVWDLSNPANPVERGTLVTDDIPLPYYGYYYGGWDHVAGFGYYFYNEELATPTDNALVFSGGKEHQELQGTLRSRHSYPVANRWENCYDQTTYEPKACTYLTGGISCRQLTRVDGTVEDEVCYGSYARCTQDDTGEATCEEVTPAASEIREYTNEYDQHRYWVQRSFTAVDLTDPDAPSLGSTVNTATKDESVRFFANGNSIFHSFKRPYRLAGDSRPYVKYYFQEIDLNNPSAVVEGAEINVPGELLRVDGDVVVTRDFLWGRTIVESSVNKLELVGDAAYLRGVNRFVDRVVNSVELDGAGHVLVSHNPSWRVDSTDYKVHLSVLDLDSANFARLATVEIDDWASLAGAIPGKALFRVPSGMLLVNIEEPAQAHAQAYFPVRGWPRSFQIDGDDIRVAAGPYGIFTFDASTYNLTEP